LFFPGLTVARTFYGVPRFRALARLALSLGMTRGDHAAEACKSYKSSAFQVSVPIGAIGG
ncbi:MAG: hypothetical protein V4710_02360, partial [Verrucomicrobiota bacterium]